MGSAYGQFRAPNSVFGRRVRGSAGLFDHDGLDLRGIVGTLTVELLYRDQRSFQEKIREEAHNDLDAMGIGLVIDDFGTGGASLAYLGKFPIHRVKIDRRFTASVAEGRENATLADAIFAMTKSLGLRTVAGGIETIEQADFFRARGCDELQGFLFGPGVDAQGFERFLERDKDE